MKEQLKEYYCLNDYIMECPELKGEAAFLKGKKYLFNNQMIAKSELFDEHDLSDEIDFDRYFILQSEWGLLQQKSGKLPKQQLRTEAEKYLKNRTAPQSFEKVVDMLVDFHAQQSKDNTEAIDRLKAIIEACLKGSFFRFELSKVLKDLGTESQQSKERGWISVKDRFPDEKQTVWCYSEKLDNVFLGEYVYVINEGWFWAESNGVVYASNGKIVTECEMDDFDVSHWFPTPLLPNKSTLTK